ncbi:transcription factor TFIIIB component B'' homolog isoform X2 [Mixophyes fleayi]|uniref:transcription factor TFIIIB component B'' homolog isoform X2 n=1 Tax=Mixophyes fleayi TaxID=3061075 RepID=UPI003F4DAC23
MIRRARLSFKPNVRPSVRAPGVGAGAAGSSGGDGGVAPPPDPAHESGKDNVTGGTEESENPAITGSTVSAADIEEQSKEENGTEPHGKTATVSNESQPTKSSTPFQRRKRISTLPNLVKPRISSSTPVVAPSPKSPQVEIRSSLPVGNVPCQTEVSPSDKVKLLSPPKSQAPLPASPGQHVALPEKRTPVPQVPQFSPYKKSVLNHPGVSPVKSVESAQREELSPLKERPSQKSINEDFVTNKQNIPKRTIVGNLEKERLRRSQKLRELLRDELRKERRIWKEKHPVIPTTVEPERSKMVMRDFIHFIPSSNPMTSSIEETKTSEKSEKSPAESQVTGPVVKTTNNVDEDELDEEDDDDSQLLAPRVKVAEDGSIILDEESLTVEVIRNKAPIVEGNDPIFERGSTTTYSSFRKSNYSKPWSNPETDMFFLAISMVGTDFSMIGQLFPHRERIEIKNKFKREERANGWRIDKAFREKRCFDFEFFAQLLGKALEEGKKKPKTPRIKQPREKKTTNKSRKKQKDKSAAEQNLSDGESAVMSEGERADARMAEKENEGSLSGKECPPVTDTVPGKKRRSRKKKGDVKEPEEENHESQGDDLPQKPKKKESKKKSKTSAGNKDCSAEPESAVNDKSLKDVQTEKKRVRHKKTIKETELEDAENGDTDPLQGSTRSKCSTKKSCDIPDDTVDDAHTFNETADVDLSLAALPCEEESSLVLFTEESECPSGLDDLSSMQDSLSEAQQPVTPASDVSLVAQNITLGDAGSMDTSQEEPSPAVTDLQSSTSVEKLDAGVGEPEDQDLEHKNKQQMVRGRCVRPVPNLSKSSVKKKVSSGERGDTEHPSGPSEHSVQSGQVAVDNKKIPEEDAKVVDNRTDIEVRSEESMNKNVHEESSIQSAPLVRGRFQRPKPNVQVKTSAKTKKLEVTEEKEIPMRESAESTDVSSAVSQGDKEDMPVSENLDSEEMEVSAIDENHRQDSFISAPVSCPIQKDFASESPPEKSDAVPIDSAKDDINNGKPSLPVRGRLLKPKPNLTKAPARIKPSVTQQNVLHVSHSEDFAQVACTASKSPSYADTRSQSIEIKENSESSHSSQDECKRSPIKPAILARGRFQKPIPNVIKTSGGKDKSDMKDDSSGECAIDPAGANSSNFPSCIQNAISPGKQENQMSLCESDGVGSTSAQGSSHSEEDLYSDPLSSLQVNKESDLIPSVSPVNHIQLTESESQAECKRSPIKPTPLIRGRMLRPKPNLLKTAGRKVVPEVREGKTCEVTSENTVEKITLDNNDDSSVLGKSAELVQEVPSLDESCGQEKSSLEPSDLAQPVKGDLESKVSVNVTEETQKSLKPAVLNRGRFQRPKPNLGRAATKREPLTSPNDQKSLPKGETCVQKVLEPDVTPSTLSAFEAEKTLSLAKSNKEDTVCPGKAVTQPCTPPLETLQSEDTLPGVGRADGEEPASTSEDYFAHVRIYKEQSGSEDERKSDSMKPSGRFQKPKPNLARAATRPQKSAVLEESKTVEGPQVDTSSIGNNEGPICSQDVDISAGEIEIKSCAAEGPSIQLHKENIQGDLKVSVQHEEATCTREQGVGSSVKPMRARFPKAKPNIGRAAVRKTPAIDPRTLTSEQDEVELEVVGKMPESLNSEEVSDTSLNSHYSKEAGRANEEKSTAIKPAQLSRFRLMRPIPNLVGPPSKRPSPLQSKKSDEVEGSPVLTDKNPTLEMHLSSPVNKRKASECDEVMPKRCRLPDKSHKPSCLSDSDVDQVSLPSEVQNSSQSSNVTEQSNPQQSRFGRLLRKPLSTTPPVLPKVSETSSERPENEKTVRSVRPGKSKVSKPVSNKSKGKTTLVKIRATQQEDEEEEDAELDFEEENYNLAPDMLNQAPVFVPFSLRSPKYTPAEIEETVEELEIPVEVGDVPSNTSQESGKSSNLTLQHVLVSQEKTDDKEHYDGSTEAAMTLISMGNSASQSNIGESPSSDHCTKNELPPNAGGSQNDVEQIRGITSLSSPTSELLSSNKHAGYVEDNNPSVNTRSVEDYLDAHSSPAGGSFLRPDKTQADTVMLHSVIESSDNSLHTLNDNIVPPLEQSYPSTQEEVQQHDFMCQDVSVSDTLLDNSCPPEEATFILTLVEIPISEEYSYSCDSNSADSLPAPVLISSASSQALTQPQNQSFVFPVSPESVSHEPCTAVQEDTELMLSQSSGKRIASCLSDGDETPPEKKALRCNSAQQEEEYKISAADCDKIYTQEASTAEPRPENTSDFTQSSAHTADSPKRGKKLRDSTQHGDSVHTDKPVAASMESVSRNLPAACVTTPSTSKTPLKRPGRKALGFLPLVCKEKHPKKANEETIKKKSLSKCKKVPSLVGRPHKPSPVLNEEDAASSKVPSQSTASPPAVTPVPNNEESITPECQVSDNQATEPQEQSKLLDLATEEEAAPVSEYFFSDIFMQIDD